MRRSIWGHDDDERWDQYERTWQGFLAVLGASLALSWLFSLSTQMEVEMLAPKIEGPVATVELVKTPTTAGVAQESRQPVDSTTLAAHREIRRAMAERVAERRADVEAVAQVERQTVVTTTSTVPVVTTTTQAWQPADECGKVVNPGPIYLTDQVMSWCPSVAHHLARYDWNPGDLFRLMLSMRCESNGDPGATNPSSGTAGLFQHRPRYWSDRSRLAGLGPDADPYDPHDNIHVAVWLVKTRQPFEQAWDGCHARPEFKETLRNAGL